MNKVRINRTGVAQWNRASHSAFSRLSRGTLEDAGSNPAPGPINLLTPALLSGLLSYFNTF